MDVPCPHLVFHSQPPSSLSFMPSYKKCREKSEGCRKTDSMKEKFILLWLNLLLYSSIKIFGDFHVIALNEDAINLQEVGAWSGKKHRSSKLKESLKKQKLKTSTPLVLPAMVLNQTTRLLIKITEKCCRWLIFRCSFI